MDRISKLRLLALEPHKREDEFYYKFFKKFSSVNSQNKYDKYAQAAYYAFSQLTPAISDGELIVGKCDNIFSDSELKEWNDTYLAVAENESAIAGRGQDSHMAIDYDLILNAGITGIIEKIDSYLKTCEEAKVPFYNACKKCLEGVIEYAENYSKYAFELSENTSDEKRKKELIKISQVCKNVKKHTF